MISQRIATAEIESAVAAAVDLTASERCLGRFLQCSTTTRQGQIWREVPYLLLDQAREVQRTHAGTMGTLERFAFAGLLNANRVEHGDGHVLILAGEKTIEAARRVVSCRTPVPRPTPVASS